MKPFFLLTVLCFLFKTHGLSEGAMTNVAHDSSRVKRNSIPSDRTSSSNEKCAITLIPAMSRFDMNKFSGTWYELAKTVSGYVDFDDGRWKIIMNNASSERYKFLFSGRDNSQRCIRPIPGSIEPSDSNPGEITFRYRTYSTSVLENLRVLFTDYNTYAALYMCVQTDRTGQCHPGTSYGSIWTREPQVHYTIFDSAARVLKKACVEKHTLRIRTIRGSCNLDDIDVTRHIPPPNFCYQPVSPGSCQGRMKRYYYNDYEKMCHEFEYSGCGENENNFVLKKECENTCIDHFSQENCRETAVCELSCPPCCREVNNGCVKCSCESIIVDPVHDCFPDAFQCPVGCEAEEKHQGCYTCVCEVDYPPIIDEVPPECLEVKDRGKCDENTEHQPNIEERFSFNIVSGKCEVFNYTGCAGTKNNFRSYEECARICKDLTINQADPLDPGDPDSVNRISPTHCVTLLISLLSVVWLRQ